MRYGIKKSAILDEIRPCVLKSGHVGEIRLSAWLLLLEGRVVVAYHSAKHSENICWKPIQDGRQMLEYSLRRICSASSGNPNSTIWWKGNDRPARAPIVALIVASRDSSLEIIFWL